jgi:two-component system cell cycle sensor histidine kinase/response regulator CckA
MPTEQPEYQDQLVRGLAHRMNNILTLFHGYLGLLTENQKLDKATLEGLAKIKAGARAASDLMDRTHSLVRPTSSVWREIDLGAFTGMLQPGFEALCGPRTKLECEIPDELPLVHGDAARIKTAIIELVKNACEATFASGGTVQIELRGDAPPINPSHAQQPLKWVAFSVTDNGPGVPEEMAEKVFAPFFSTKKKQNAAGLGLTVAQSVARQHGGVLRLISEDGWTKFELLLPASGE